MLRTPFVGFGRALVLLSRPQIGKNWSTGIDINSPLLTGCILRGYRVDGNCGILVYLLTLSLIFQLGDCWVERWWVRKYWCFLFQTMGDHLKKCVADCCSKLNVDAVCAKVQCEMQALSKHSLRWKGGNGNVCV